MVTENLLLGGLVFLFLVSVGFFIYARHTKSVMNSKIDSLHRAIKKSNSGERVDSLQETVDTLQKQINSYIVEKNNEASHQEKEFARTRFLNRGQGGQPNGPAGGFNPNMQAGQAPQGAPTIASNAAAMRNSFGGRPMQQPNMGPNNMGMGGYNQAQGPQQPQQGNQQQRMPYGNFNR